MAVTKWKRFLSSEKYEMLQELDRRAKQAYVQEKYRAPQSSLVGFICEKEEIGKAVMNPVALETKTS